MVILFFGIFGCSEEDGNNPELSGANSITSFRFLASDNEGLTDDLMGTINE